LLPKIAMYGMIVGNLSTRDTCHLHWICLLGGHDDLVILVATSKTKLSHLGQYIMFVDIIMKRKQLSRLHHKLALGLY
ncbi:hypothetical protein ACQP3J_32635, partial [Escherichia coli]